jgi:2-polyprenyl-3-methyl-5-hydroxy-6-metoxy-1,4-benzoquinol methylase
MFADPLPTEEEIRWLYRHRYDYSWFIQRRALKREQARHRWTRLRTLFRELNLESVPRHLLDVGGGHAWFLRAAQAEGWRVEGLELLDDAMLAEAKEHGIVIHHGSLTGHSLAAETFGVVTAWHVIEHIPEIRRAIAAIGELLMPGGVGVIAMPNYHCAGMEREGVAWVWCQKPFIHPWHVSAKTLERLVPASLEILRTTSRDTWDAQWVETTGAYGLAMKGIYYATRVPRKVAAILGWTGGVKVCERVQFWMEEGLRLMTYAGYLVVRPVIKGSYEDGLRGSELMLVVRKKTDDAVR